MASVDWKPWPSQYLAGAKFYPGASVRYEYFLGTDVSRWRSSIQRACTAGDGFHALYLGEEQGYLTGDDLAGAAGFINSPLTDDLRTLKGFDEQIYAKAVQHLWGVLNHTRRSLLTLSQLDAWQKITEMESGASEWLEKRARLPRSHEDIGA
ncbi:hypothetical protein ACSBOB_33295 [Mesorhizobium sp. ASY16-5R]|uniref:hypothetical protein n=1 Tax=Mesorhizobium sp. ASY16-5R TaxID=3445772 RepID=UPI003FA0ECDD